MHRPRSRLSVLAVTAFAAAFVLTACSGSSPTGTPAPSSATGSAVSGELTVFAAASLSTAFDEIAAQFEAENPDVHVNPITYDGSSTLATQIVEGAAVDVFASADRKNMDKVAQAGLADEAPVFATNVLQIAVAPGNPRGIDDLASLADPGLTLVLCAPAVPCGAAAQTLLGTAGVTVTPASEEQNVSAVLAKVKAGEADAGLVYATDVKAAGSAVTGVRIAGADKAVNEYPIAVLKGAKNAAAATAFQEFVLSEQGRRILDDLGFGDR